MTAAAVKTDQQSTVRPARYRSGPDIPPAFVYRLIESFVGRYWTKMAYRSGRGRTPVGVVDRDLYMTVDRIEDEGDDVRTLRLARTDGTELPPWDPGAHVDVVLPSGRLRQYSLNGDPDDLRSYRIAVRRIDPAHGGGGGSAEVHTLEVGQHLTLKGPRNAFPLVRSTRGYVLVAGGIGITPILPMLRDVVDRGDAYELIYTGRTRSSMPFLEEIRNIVGEHPIHVWPDDEFGVPDASKLIELAPEGAVLYVCGPPPLIEAIRAQLPDPQIDALHYERFSPPPVLGGKAFTIELAASGTSVEVSSVESALTAVRRARPGQAYSCQQGFCGTCKVRVVAGTVEHRDKVLTESERSDHMMLCVSRADGTVSIEV